MADRFKRPQPGADAADRRVARGGDDPRRTPGRGKTERTTTERFATDDSDLHQPRRWGLWLAIDGDLRFLSHRDCLRLVERATTRAGLPLKHTQGFNPHPVLSLPAPRPVGVASRDDLAVMSLIRHVSGEDILQRLNRQVPRGMRWFRALPLADGPPPRPRSARFRWPVPPGRGAELAERVSDFAGADSVRVRRTRRKGRDRTLELKALVADLAVADGALTWTLLPDGDVWARPAELLDALGLDPRVDLANVVRTAVDYGI